MATTHDDLQGKFSGQPSLTIDFKAMGSWVEPFVDHLRKIQQFNHMIALAHWDLEVNMPQGAVGPRSEAIAALETLLHQKLTDGRWAGWIQQLEKEAEHSPQKEYLLALVRECRREVEQANKLPAEFVEAFSMKTAEAQVCWTEARKEKRFAMFSPLLQDIVRMCRQKAEYLGFEESPYNALLDQFEPHLTVKFLDTMFGELKRFLIPLVAATAKKPRPQDDFLSRSFPKVQQLEFSRTLLDAIGFDLSRGRLDESVHPFSSEIGSALDVRLTTRCTESMPMECLLAVLHEGGHGLYEQGIDPTLPWPVSGAISLGIHESQSRLWENMVGRSYPFWKVYFPALQKAFPGCMDDVSLDAFYRALNIVEPGFIRIEADEVTYNLHIILRYEIERAVIEGTLDVQDIPSVWNEKMKTYLGLTPPDDALGCLQDVHWSHGAFGYFPTYTLGNLYAAQMFESVQRKLPELSQEMNAQVLMDLRRTLGHQVHRFGRLMTADSVCQHATGRPLEPRYFAEYLQSKFYPLYDL